MMKETKGMERRKWERLPLAIPVFVRGLDQNGRQFVDFATALDISVGGALLAIHRFLPKGSKILLEIPSAPVSANPKVPRATRQRLYARAVRVSDGENCKLMGLQFQKPLLMGHAAASPKPRSKPKLKSKAAEQSS
jgi:hypothetical protein